MTPLDRKTLDRFLQLAGDRMRGTWVVIGGCVPHLLGLGQRTTYDIDIAGPADARMDQALVLMGIAEELGLPVEAINHAGAFFLHKIKDWEAHVVPIHTGAHATINIPDATLFLLLKLGRLTEADLGDCLEMVSYATRGGTTVDAGRIIRAATEVRARGISDGQSGRIDTLLKALARD